MPTYSQSVTTYVAADTGQEPDNLLAALYSIGSRYSAGFSLTGQGALAGYTLVIPASGHTTGNGDPSPELMMRYQRLPAETRRSQLAIAQKLLVPGNVLTISTTDYTCYARVSYFIERNRSLHNPGEVLTPP